MNPSSGSTGLVRFDVFEIDLQSGELRKPGSKIRLQDKPLQILTLLLECPGRVVTREEFQKRLWPDGIIVDFEHGINSAVKRLRQALGDDAEHPCFIETLPRHGYRFMVPVEPITPILFHDERGEPGTGKSDPGAPAREADGALFAPQASPFERRQPAGQDDGSSDGIAVHDSPGPGRWIFVAAGGLALAVSGVLLFFNVGGLRDRLFTASGARRALPSARIQSLAVLPFEDLACDTEQEYFADGMTDAVITDLSKVGPLRLISRTSVMQYKGTKKPLPQIARELNVDAVVEGTVLRLGNRVRITAQLILANPERHLWAESYERDLRDILSMQEEVAQAIAQEIRISVTPPEQAGVSKTRPVNPEAYRLYLQGKFQNRRLSERAFRKAIEDFEQSVKLDPTYAPAYAGLSLAYQEAGGWHTTLPFIAFHTQARNAALKALELDDNLAEAHIALGWIEFYEWNWAGADRELRRGMDLNPIDTLARIAYACYLTVTGRFEESIAVGKQTIELDPLSPDAYNELGWALMFAGRDAEALVQFKKGLDLDPRFAQSHRCLAGFYVRKGMNDEAVVHMRKTESFMDETRPAYWLGSLALYYAQAGRREDARRILGELELRTKTEYVSASALARVYLGLGEKEKALRFLEKAFEDRDISLVWLNVDWGYDPLRSEPRFQNLLLRMNFPP